MFQDGFVATALKSPGKIDAGDVYDSVPSFFILGKVQALVRTPRQSSIY